MPAGNGRAWQTLPGARANHMHHTVHMMKSGSQEPIGNNRSKINDHPLSSFVITFLQKLMHKKAILEVLINVVAKLGRDRIRLTAYPDF